MEDNIMASNEAVANHNFSTTFWMDFSIADRFGVKAVKDTYHRAFKAWKHDYRYLTDLVIVLNHKIWQHYDDGKGNQVLAKCYDELWKKADAYAVKHLKDEEAKYFFEMTD